MTKERERRPLPEEMLPLKPKVFHILLSLADRSRHGYAILHEVEERSGGTVRLKTGPLYRYLKALLDDGLVAEAPSPEPEGDDPRRRYYRLTGFGRRVLTAEARRLVTLVDAARALEVLEKGRGA